MKQHKLKKCFIFSALMLLMLNIFIINAYAKNISKVKLNISGPTPMDGDPIGSISCSSEQGFYVSSCDYINGFDEWTIGDIPIVEIYLETESNYKFTKDTSSYFTLTGMGARYVDATLYENGDELKLTVALKKVSSRSTYNLYPPDDIGWDEQKIYWSSVPDATGYDVELSLNESVIATFGNQRTKVSISRYITKPGEYSFRVRSTRGTIKGEWSEYASSVFSKVNPEKKEDNSGSDTKKKPADDSKGNQPPYPTTAGWNQSSNGWWYLNTDGSFPYRGWANINNRWYFFDANGYMKTGWVLVNNLFYYLGNDGALWVNTTTPDGYKVNADGVRVFSTGNGSVSSSIPNVKGKTTEGWRYYNSDGSYVVNAWKQINNKWYYFDSQGYSKTGWLNDKGLYYYLGEDGALLVNTTTPDGHVVNADGVMIK